MATIAHLMPLAAEFPASSFPELRLINRRPCLAFDASSNETVYWTLVAPEDLTTPLILVMTYIMASATSGNIIMQVAVEAVSDGDATDLDAGTSFDTTNSTSATAVPGTAGYIDQLALTLTNGDSVAPGDYLRISVNRNAASGSDTATGDLYLLAAELRDSA